MQTVELLLALCSFFFMWFLSPKLGFLSIQLIKSITAMLGEAIEGQEIKIFLKNFILTLKFLFQFFLIAVCGIFPLVPFFLSDHAKILDPSIILFISINFFMVLDILLSKSTPQTSLKSFFEQLLLYFFYYDLRWAYQLSKISQKFFMKRSNYNKNKLKNSIFIISTARSGTTAVTTKLIANKGLNGIVYKNLPFTLCPEFFQYFRKRNPVKNKRLHTDQNEQDNNTTDAFDEPMMVVLDHWKDVSTYLSELEEWHTRIANNLNSEILIFKNNNNFRRLNRLMKFEKARFLVLFRNPLETARSLRKNHLLFKEIAKKDDFFLAYLRMMRHREFGPLHNSSEWHENDFDLTTENLEYWLTIWIEFASLSLTSAKIHPDKFLFLCTDEKFTDRMAEKLAKKIVCFDTTIKPQISLETETSESHKQNIENFSLMKQATVLYNQLKMLEVKC